MIGPLPLLLAFALDLLIGDPRWLPHPVRIMGRCIGSIERLLRARFTTPASEQCAGVLLVLLITVPAFLITFIIIFTAWLLPGAWGKLIGMAIIVYLTATTIAIRELITSVRAVIRPIKEGDIEKARHNLSMIVGRDTQHLAEEDILKAAMETLAENLSDGFIAPLFYLAIGGLPLAIVYKAINTLDSMIGYKNNAYRHFGRAAARLDDVANFLPARITGMLIVAATFLVMPFRDAAGAFTAARRSFIVMLRDGRKHLSPNSGIPEAAMAGALGIRMGGPSAYGGVMIEKPYIGEAQIKEGTGEYLAASARAIAIAGVTSLLGIGIAALVLLARRVP